MKPATQKADDEKPATRNSFVCEVFCEASDEHVCEASDEHFCEVFCEADDEKPATSIFVKPSFVCEVSPNFPKRSWGSSWFL